MSHRERWVLASLGILVGIALILMVVSEVIDTARNETLAMFCRGERYPNTWRAGGEPRWAGSEERVVALCAVTAWLRWEFGWSLEPTR